MASAHERDLPCAQCLHPRDDLADTPIPTAAFVSFWAGLLLGVRFLRHLAGESVESPQQQSYLTALRPEAAWESPIDSPEACPTCASLDLKFAADKSSDVGLLAQFTEQV